MANLDKYPTLSRIIFSLLVVYLFGVGIINFYRYMSSTTVENMFGSSPSNLYITKSFPSLHSNQQGSQMSDVLSTPDSILVGDLLIAVNDNKLTKIQITDQFFNTIPNDSALNFQIFRSSEDKYFNYTLQRSALPDSFFRFLSTTVYISEVTKGGASDLAGIKAGDYIFQINGQTFDNSFEAGRILRRAKSGQIITYDIIRKNETLNIPVTLASYGISLSILSLFLSSLVFWGTGAFILINRPHIQAARLVGLSLLTVGFFLMVIINQHDFEFDLFAKIRTLTWGACFVFGIVFFAHSKIYFPQVRPEILNKRWLTKVPYILAFIVFIIFSLFVLAFINNTRILYISFVTILASMFVYIAVIQLIYRKQRSMEYKKLNRVIFWTAILAGLSIVTLTYVLNTTGNQGQFGFIGLPLIFIPLSYLYTIGRYQLLEMKLYIRRNIQYIIVTSIWVSALVVLLLKVLVALPDFGFVIPNIRFTGTSIVILDEPPQPELYAYLEKIILMFFSLGLTFVFWKIGQTGRQFIDRKFYRSHEGYSRAASELAEVMATKLDMMELSRGIAQKIARLMQLKRAGVLIFRDQKECCCHEAYGFDSAKWDAFCLKSDQLLINAIQKFRSESRFSTEYLPEGLKETFVKYGLRHIIPIRFKNKLSGTLVIGEKLSEMPLLLEDLTFLAAVAKQTSVAIENSFLHAELAEQERMKHELEIARRIQMASLPQKTPKISGLDIAGICIPAMEVGGDYFDYLNGITHDITVIVGDVSGKGTSAALYMSKIQGIIRSLHEFKLTPRELFIRANQLLCKDMEKNSFVTAIGAAIDTNKKCLILARAGHLPLYYFHAQSKKVKLITPKGIGLGLDEAEVFTTEMEEIIIRYHVDDVFLFVTDGVTEARTIKGNEFGEDNLVKTLALHSSLSADKIRDQVISEVKRFAANSLQHDDQTVVVVKAR